MAYHTYAKRLGNRNLDRKPVVRRESPFFGQIFDWYTKEVDGEAVVCCFPDQWEGEFPYMERIPDDVEVHYMGSELTTTKR